MLPHLASDPSDVPLLKGSHVMQGEALLDERLGPGAFRGLAEAESLLSRMLLPGTWYEAGAFVRVMSAAAPRLGLSLEEVARDVARRNALADLTSIYRVFLRLASPHRTLAFTPRLWALYARYGETRVLSNEEGQFLAECVRIPDELFEWSCGAWLGFLPAAVEVAGGRDAVSRIVGRSACGAGRSTLRFAMHYHA